MATKKAEKEVGIFKEEHAKKTGWRSYLPSMLKSSYLFGSKSAEDSKQSQDKEDQLQVSDRRDPQDVEIQKQLDLILAKSEQITKE